MPVWDPRFPERFYVWEPVDSTTRLSEVDSKILERALHSRTRRKRVPLPFWIRRRLGHLCVRSFPSGILNRTRDHPCLRLQFRSALWSFIEVRPRRIPTMPNGRRGTALAFVGLLWSTFVGSLAEQSSCSCSKPTIDPPGFDLS